MPCLCHVERNVVLPCPQRDRLGLQMLDRSWLRAEGGNAGDGCRVTEFNMAGSNDTAECQHVQRGSFLSLARSAQLYVMDR